MKCGHCFEITTVSPCEHCGRPIRTRAPEEARDFVLDRMRGGPRSRLQDIADEAGLSLDELLDGMKRFVTGDQSWQDMIRLGVDSPDVDLQRFWDDFELVTGTPVPPDKRNSPFTCAC